MSSEYVEFMAAIYQFEIGDRVCLNRSLKMTTIAIRKKNRKEKIIPRGSVGIVVKARELPVTGTPVYDIKIGETVYGRVKDVYLAVVCKNGERE